MIQPFDAAYTTAILSDAYLAFNDTPRLADESFTISNIGNEAITYELDAISAATAYTFSNSKRPDSFSGLQLDDAFAKAHLSGKSEVVVKVTPPLVDAARLPVYGGYIRINGTNGKRLSLPYQDITGDLNAQTVLNTTYLSSWFGWPDPALGAASTFLFPRVSVTDIKDNNTDNFPVAVDDMFFGPHF